MVSSVTVLAFLASAFVAVVHADFHVFGQQGTIYLYYEDGTDIITDNLIACSSNDLSCDGCYVAGLTATESGDDLGMNWRDKIFPDSGVWSMKAGLCGAPQLDFYDQGNGHWEVYSHDGDGSLAAAAILGPNRLTCALSSTVGLLPPTNLSATAAFVRDRGCKNRIAARGFLEVWLEEIPDTVKKEWKTHAADRTDLIHSFTVARAPSDCDLSISCVSIYAYS
jgi:hypothetical protein